MELQQLLREIHWIEWQLRTFEDRYGVRSQDFYQAMESGQLADFDDIEDPHFHDFLEWHALYKIWLNRESAYRDIMSRQALVERLRTAPLTV